jgi:hypothetical protein
MKQWRAGIWHRPEFWRRHDLFLEVTEIGTPTPDASGQAIYNVEMVRRQLTTRHGLVEPFASFDDFEDMRAFLQPIVNEAARLGILPQEGASEQKALRAHLEDMRALVFEKGKP